VEVALPAHGIRNRRVLDAMAAVPRHEFVPPTSITAAYEDVALPIACHQSISQPSVVAMMCEAAQLTGGERVLEVGTGSGYGAAVLSRLAARVDTVERIPELADHARDTLARLGFDRVHVHEGDGSQGWPAAAPFDAIVVTAGAAGLPLAYPEQLADGGRIVIPIGHPERGQTMYRLTLRGRQLAIDDLGEFRFVPLVVDDEQTAGQAANSEVGRR
jgi:protein-L-isoaspartate(D-aspartate) O-methyltransferase